MLQGLVRCSGSLPSLVRALQGTDNSVLPGEMDATQQNALMQSLAAAAFNDLSDDDAAAADFEIPGVDNRELARWIRNNLEVDQGILEFYKDGEPSSGWIHCSYSRNSNRQQWLRAMREDGKTVYKPWLGQ